MRKAKITFDVRERNWLEWFMLHLATGNKGQDVAEKFIRNEDGTFTAEVTVIMNGHDVSAMFGDCIERLEGEFDRNVRKVASEMVQERLNDIFEGSYEIQQETERRMCELLGVTRNENGDWEYG
jgi:hypothetical protein